MGKEGNRTMKSKARTEARPGVLEQALALQPEWSEMRHYFHRNPELGLDLPVTTAKVREVLSSYGIPHENLGPAGIRARIGRDGGRRILFRGDMDALPIEEATGLPFASTNPGRMHACGHDLHTTMLLGAAKLLKLREEDLDGEVVLMFQPGEETADGAATMIRAGVLEPAPDRAVAIHVSASEEYPTGVAVLNASRVLASCDRFTVTVIGKGGHGSEPQNCRNPIYGALRIIESLTDLSRFETTPQSPLVLTVCRIEAGTAPNIIPETAIFAGTLRMVDEAARAIVKERMRTIVESVAAAHAMQGRLVFDESIPMVANDPSFTREVHGWLSDGLDGMIVAPLGDYSAMGSDDFALISGSTPSCYLYILSHSPEGRHFTEHNPGVIHDDDAAAYGAAAFAQIALRYLAARSPESEGRQP